MRLLLDTHALLWWLSDDNRLGVRARALIEYPGNDVLVNVVSLWEIADAADFLVTVGKRDLLGLRVYGAPRLLPFAVSSV